MLILVSLFLFSVGSRYIKIIDFLILLFLPLIVLVVTIITYPPLNNKLLFQTFFTHYNLKCLSGSLPVVKPPKLYSLANGLRCIGMQMTRTLRAFEVELQATRIITDFHLR